MLINALIVNRNLFSTLKNTVDFLSQRKEINIIILDQGTSYEPTLNYYKNNPQLTILEFPDNDGPRCVWGDRLKPYHSNPFILCDSDCTYDNIPNDWLDVMIHALYNTERSKVGFSIEIDDLPNNPIALRVKDHESQFWTNKNELGYISDIDTTFAMYRDFSGFTYDAIRLPRPYTMKHVAWYLDTDNLDEEWSYYINNVTGHSVWGSTIKQTIHDNK